jgi:predicted dithiol-disulfide oxidoreductase (DUF899 family)
MEKRVTTRDEWLAERRQLLEREQELNRLGEELTKQRRALPWVPVEKEYRFAADEGGRMLADLFDGRSQLLVYHMMFGPEWTAACPVCTNVVDELDLALVHLNNNGVSLAIVAHAPLEKVQAYRRRMDWDVPCVSSFDSDFNYDFGVSFTQEQRREGGEYNFGPIDFDQVVEEMSKSEIVVKAAESCGITLDEYVTTEGPGLSAFMRDDGSIFHTYSVYAPDAMLMLTWSNLLERTPSGDDAVTAILRRDEYPTG